jgi:HD-like signal output (HDOD) protein
MDGMEFQQLVKTFQSVETLPQIPESAFRLVQVCDDPDSSLHDAEHVIASDPGLTAMILRAASTARYVGLGRPVTTVATAIMRIGLKSLKSLAMTHAFRTLLDQGKRSDWYDPRRLAGHSVFVAVTMQHLFDEAYGHSHYDLEEVFAFGLLHDLGICLLAEVAPEQFDSIWVEAEKRGDSFEDAFQARFHEPVATLSWAAAAAWQLPDIFVEFLHAITNRDEPSDLGLAVESLAKSEELATSIRFCFEPWMEGSGQVATDSAVIDALVGAFNENWQGPAPFLHQAA